MAWLRHVTRFKFGGQRVHDYLVNLLKSICLQQKQQSQLKQAMDESVKRSNDAQQAKKNMETRQQQDSNVLEQLKAIVTEKETKIKSLELEVCQLRTVAVCRLRDEDHQHIIYRIIHYVILFHITTNIFICSYG